MKKENSNFFQLSFQLAKSGFKLRNEGSYLGILWYLLNPLLLFILLLLIFSDRLGVSIPQYPLYLLIGIIMFDFFQSSTTESTRIIIKDYGDLIKSINFPKEALILGITLKSVFSHLFEMLLLMAFILIFRGSLTGLIFYPLILLLFCIFIFGASLILSSLTVYFIDLENIWNFAVRLIWLGTPIFYSIGGQTKLFYINLLNPIYYFIIISRDIVIYSSFPQLWIVFGALFYSLLFLITGLLIFKKLKIKFAEML
jgi:ABC-type polysaccharide/polyol phosphate export permease